MTGNKTFLIVTALAIVALLVTLARLPRAASATAAKAAAPTSKTVGAAELRQAAGKPPTYGVGTEGMMELMPFATITLSIDGHHLDVPLLSSMSVVQGRADSTMAADAEVLVKPTLSFRSVDVRDGRLTMILEMFGNGLMAAAAEADLRRRYNAAYKVGAPTVSSLDLWLADGDVPLLEVSEEAIGTGTIVIHRKVDPTTAVKLRAAIDAQTLTARWDYATEVRASAFAQSFSDAAAKARQFVESKISGGKDKHFSTTQAHELARELELKYVHGVQGDDEVKGQLKANPFTPAEIVTVVPTAWDDKDITREERAQYERDLERQHGSRITNEEVAKHNLVEKASVTANTKNEGGGVPFFYSANNTSSGSNIAATADETDVILRTVEGTQFCYPFQIRRYALDERKIAAAIRQRQFAQSNKGPVKALRVAGKPVVWFMQSDAITQALNELINRSNRHLELAEERDRAVAERDELKRKLEGNFERFKRDFAEFQRSVHEADDVKIEERSMVGAKGGGYLTYNAPPGWVVISAAAWVQGGGAAAVRYAHSELGPNPPDACTWVPENSPKTFLTVKIRKKVGNDAASTGH